MRREWKRVTASLLGVMLLLGAIPVAAETIEDVQRSEKVINHGEAVLSPEKEEIIRENYIAFANDPELVEENIIIGYYGTFDGYDAVSFMIAGEETSVFGWELAFGFDFRFETKEEAQRFYLHKDGDFIQPRIADEQKLITYDSAYNIAKNFDEVYYYDENWNIREVLNAIDEKRMKEACLERLKENNPDSAEYKEYTSDDILIKEYYGTWGEKEIFIAYPKNMDDYYSQYPEEARIGGYVFNLPYQFSSCFYAWEEGSLLTLEEARDLGELESDYIGAVAKSYGHADVLPGGKYEDVTFLNINLEIEGWFSWAVSRAYSMGIMKGMDENTFGPFMTLSRAQFVTILYRLAQPLSEDDNAMVNNPKDVFPDVEAGTWYTEAVMWAYQNGIVTGYEDGTFGPADLITREELAAMLYRYAEYKGFDVTKTEDLADFVDVSDVSTYASDALKWCVGNGIVVGNDGHLKPQDTATRAECAVMVVRFAEKYE